MSPADRFPLSLGEFVRRQREVAELSLKQLAGMAGISNPYLSQIEHGLREPSAKVLQGLAKSLQVSVDDLMDAAGGGGAGGGAEPPLLVGIRADPNLTARQRQALAEVYTAMVEVTAARRGRRGEDL